jgi:hypothetical protein
MLQVKKGKGHINFFNLVTICLSKDWLGLNLVEKLNSKMIFNEIQVANKIQQSKINIKFLIS